MTIRVKKEKARVARMRIAAMRSCGMMPRDGSDPSKELPLRFTQKTKEKILRRMEQLLSARGGFTQGAWKRSKDDLKKWNEDDEALNYCYCVEGAANQAAAELGYVVQTNGSQVVNLLSVQDLAEERHRMTARRVNDEFSERTSRTYILRLVKDRLGQVT